MTTITINIEKEELKEKVLSALSQFANQGIEIVEENDDYEFKLRRLNEAIKEGADSGFAGEVDLDAALKEGEMSGIAEGFKPEEFLIELNKKYPNENKVYRKVKERP